MAGVEEFSTPSLEILKTAIADVQTSVATIMTLADSISDSQAKFGLVSDTVQFSETPVVWGTGPGIETQCLKVSLNVNGAVRYKYNIQSNAVGNVTTKIYKNDVYLMGTTIAIAQAGTPVTTPVIDNISVSNGDILKFTMTSTAGIPGTTNQTICYTAAPSGGIVKV